MTRLHDWALRLADDGRDQRLLDAAEAARNAFFDRYYRPQVAQ